MLTKIRLLLRAVLALLLLHLASGTISSEHATLPNLASNVTLAASDIFNDGGREETRGTRFLTVTTYRRSHPATGIAAAVIIGALCAAAVVLLFLACCCRKASLSEPDASRMTVVYHTSVPPQPAGVAMQTMPSSGIYMYPSPVHWPPPAYEDPQAKKDGRGTFNPMMASSAQSARPTAAPPPYTMNWAHPY
uniref:Uncharacterized protein n=1 Tax=Ixodes scapularis TaxID=6945 RepID=A0A4D5RFW0_IXOSC